MGLSSLNSRCFCPCTSDYAYICVSVNFVCLRVPLRLCLACLSGCVPVRCIRRLVYPYVVSMYVGVLYAQVFHNCAPGVWGGMWIQCIIPLCLYVSRVRCVGI